MDGTYLIVFIIALSIMIYTIFRVKNSSLNQETKILFYLISLVAPPVALILFLILKNRKSIAEFLSFYQK